MISKGQGRRVAALAVIAFVTGTVSAMAADPKLVAGMSLPDARVAVKAAGWFPPAAPYCTVGKLESPTGYCGFIPGSILAAAPEIRAGRTDYPVVQLCYQNHRGGGLRLLFQYAYGKGHEEPPPASLKLVAWDYASVNCLGE